MKNSILVLVTFLIGGCGVNLRVSHVPPSSFAESLRTPGVYYTLPKTEILLAAPVIVNSAKKPEWLLTLRDGETTRSLEQIEEFCLPKSKLQGSLTKDSPAAARSLRIGSSSLERKAMPDPDHIYKLDAKFSHFANFAHTLDLSSTGVIKSADSTVTNTSVQATQFAIDVGTRVAGVGGSASVSTTDVTSFRVDWPICKTFLESSQDLRMKVKALRALQTSKSNHLKNILASPSKRAANVNLDVIKESVSAHDAAISAAEGEIAGHRSKAEFLGSSSNNYFQYIAHYDSLLATPLTPARARLIPVDKAKLTISKVNSQTFPVEVGITVDRALIQSKIQMDISKLGMAKVPTLAATETAKKKGYRYRIPGRGLLEVTVNGQVNHREEMAVAQFGHIARLPSKINGLKADIKPTFDPSTGALTKIVLGATPIVSEDVLKAFDSANALRRGIRDQPEEEPSELDLVLEENKLLEAQKTNKELKQALGIE